MSSLTLIAINAILATGIVVTIVGLLAGGIVSDHVSRSSEVTSLPASATDRLAA